MVENGWVTMEITADPETGKIIDIGCQGKKVDSITAEELEKLYQNQELKFGGLILYAKTNPKCFYYSIGGKLFKICF